MRYYLTCYALVAAVFVASYTTLLAQVTIKEKVVIIPQQTGTRLATAGSTLTFTGQYGGGVVTQGYDAVFRVQNVGCQINFEQPHAYGAGSITISPASPGGYSIRWDTGPGLQVSCLRYEQLIERCLLLSASGGKIC